MSSFEITNDHTELTKIEGAKIVWNQVEDVDYTEGGDNWTGLCANGTSQSPINIDIDRLADLQTAYITNRFSDLTEGSIFHKHDKLDTIYELGTIDFKINNKVSEWRTMQFHFHAPSEHSVNGKEYAAEMHFRSHLMNNNSQLLEFAIFLEEDKNAKDIDFFEELKLNNITSDNQTIILDYVNITKFFEPLKGSNMLKYDGSRTRPPCQEDVQWLILRRPISVNTKQLDYFRNLWEYNQNFAGGRGNNRKRKSKHC